MRRSRMAAIGFVAVLAMGALGASDASAEGLELVERSDGVLIARGASAVNEVAVGPCLVESAGKVADNGRERDRILYEPPFFSACSEGSVSGAVGRVLLTSAGVGTIRMSPVLEITLPGSCTYLFRRLTGTFPLPGIAFLSGTARGKRSMQSSRLSCPATLTTEFSAGEFGPDEEVFATS